MKPTFKEVDEKTMSGFVKTYHKKLEFDVTRVYEPPIGSFNDFGRGKWPDSIVAYETLNYDAPHKYYIRRSLLK